MILRPTRIPGLATLEPVVHADARGFFVETYRQSFAEQARIEGPWIQENHARSAQGVLRGLHFSIGPGQAKLVRCARGSIFDVAVDLRRGSPTFGQWEGVVLDDVAARQVYVPIGFAHGYYVLSDVADVVYKCSEYYDPAKERGIAWDDPEVAVDWPEGPRIVSERDESAPASPTSSPSSRSPTRPDRGADRAAAPRVGCPRPRREVRTSISPASPAVSGRAPSGWSTPRSAVSPPCVSD